MQCFFCKLVQMSNFGRLKSANGHILDRLFTNLRQFPKIHLVYGGRLLRSSIPAKNICSPIQCFFCKLVQMSNFGRLKSANGHFWIDYFQIRGKSLKSTLRIWWALSRSSSTTKKICSPMQCFFCKLVQMSNFGRLKSENGHFWIDYFQIIGKSLTSISRIWWALRRSYIITKRFCSPLQCLFCKLVQMSNFG